MSGEDKLQLSRVDRCPVSHHNHCLGMALPMVDELYETYVITKTTNILKGTSHPLHEFYSVANSSWRYVSGKSTREPILPYFSLHFYQAGQREIEGGGSERDGGETTMWKRL